MNIRNKIINDLLRLIGVTVVDGEHLRALKEEAAEVDKLGCTFEIGRALDANKSRAEYLWAAIGEECKYDLRVIMEAIEEKLNEPEEGKEANNE